MKRASIEYAHIYTNEKIGEEHELSLALLNELDTADCSLAVLIDDYSFPDPSFEYDAFVSWLSDQGHAPHVIMRESQLIPTCDEILRSVEKESVKDDIAAYVRETRKYPCSLFIAAWYALRLGYLEHPSFPEEERAERLINILPESFKPFEERGFDILASSSASGALDRIDNRYFQGRGISESDS